MGAHSWAFERGNLSAIGSADLLKDISQHDEHIWEVLNPNAQAVMWSRCEICGVTKREKIKPQKIGYIRLESDQ